MLNHNGYAAYANSKIMTASPAELTLMLYDGAIKFCNMAIAGMRKTILRKHITTSGKLRISSPSFRQH